MKKLILILFVFIGVITQAQELRLICSDMLLADTTFTFKTTTRGEIDVFVETDTVYGTTKDATLQIKQRVSDFRGTQLEGGLVTLSDTLNNFRFVKGKTPHGQSWTDIILQKNSIDSTRISIYISWQKY